MARTLERPRVRSLRSLEFQLDVASRGSGRKLEVVLDCETSGGIPFQLGHAAHRLELRHEVPATWPVAPCTRDDRRLSCRERQRRGCWSRRRSCWKAGLTPLGTAPPYTSKTNRSVKVLDFVKSGGPGGGLYTVLCSSGFSHCS